MKSAQNAPYNHGSFVKHRTARGDRCDKKPNLTHRNGPSQMAPATVRRRCAVPMMKLKAKSNASRKAAEAGHNQHVRSRLPAEPRRPDRRVVVPHRCRRALAFGRLSDLLSGLVRCLRSGHGAFGNGGMILAGGLGEPIPHPEDHAHHALRPRSSACERRR